MSSEYTEPTPATCKITVMLENATTDSAVTLLSALEVSGLLSRIQMRTEHAEHAEHTEHTEHTEPLPTPLEPAYQAPSAPVSAADFDLFVDDFLGFELQRSLDTWVNTPLKARQPRRRGKGSALPVIGETTPQNLVTLTTATRLLGWTEGRLYSSVADGVYDTVPDGFAGAYAQYYFTREQVAILKLSETLAQAVGLQRRSPRIVREATAAFLSTFQQYAAPKTSAVQKRRVALRRLLAQRVS